jgi:hypothetical protein
LASRSCSAGGAQFFSGTAPRLHNGALVFGRLTVGCLDLSHKLRSSPCLSGGLPLLRSMPPLAFRGARERLLLVQSPPPVPATRTGDLFRDKRLLLFSPEQQLSKADDGRFSQANDSAQLMSTA